MMEKTLALRGLLFGALGGLVAAVFMFFMAEPIIGRAIDYEGGRDEAKEGLEHMAAHAAGAAHSHGGGEEAELFSRGVQSTIGAGVGMIAFGAAMGGIAAVVLALWLHRRGTADMRRYVLPVVGLTFAAFYVIPTLKYPANPPAVGNSETIQGRTGLFLAMVLISIVALIVALIVAVIVHERLTPRMGARATWLAVAAAAVIVVAAWALLPSLGDLAANAGSGQSTETPQPLTDADGMIVYPGFPADDLYRFRLYSFGAQAIVWGVVALGLMGGARRLGAPQRSERRESVPAGA